MGNARFCLYVEKRNSESYFLAFLCHKVNHTKIYAFYLNYSFKSSSMKNKKTSCKTLINYTAAVKLLQDHTVYISFYTANAQLTANLIRLTQICLNYTVISH